MRLILPVLAMAICLSGCATPVTQEERASIQRVAVVSAIGSKLRVLNVAPFFINHADFEIDISSWNIDQRVENLIKKTLMDRIAIDVVDAETDYMSWDAKKLFDRLKASGQLATADTCLVITKANVIDTRIGGLGVIHEVGDDRSRVFAVYHIDLYRVSDGARIAYSYRPSDGMPRKSIKRNIGANAMKGQLSSEERPIFGPRSRASWMRAYRAMCRLSALPAGPDHSAALLGT